MIFQNFCLQLSFNKNSQTITNEFSNTLSSSKRKPNMIETDGGKEFYNVYFSELFKTQKYPSFISIYLQIKELL